MMPAPTAIAPMPLLAPRRLDLPIAWRQGVPVSGARFLAHVAAQAEALPPAGPVVNLCTDRYRFAVVLAAALLRGRTSLFPPNAMPDTLARLAADHPTLVVASDDAALAPDAPVNGLPRLALVALDEGREVGDLGDVGGGAAVGAHGQGIPLAASAVIPDVDGALAAARLLTSGSTGTPQPHDKQWRTLALNVGASAAQLSARLGLADLSSLAIVATVPAQHMFGFESSVLLALLGGASFDAGRPFYPADIAEALARVPRPRALVTTPFHLKTLLLSGVALPPVDLVLSATAPLSPQLAAQAERATGGALVEIYGCTEAGQVAMRRTAATEVWQTLGALRIHAEPADEPGGVDRYVVHGGHVEDPTPLADVLQLDDDRSFRLLGRANDLINVAGKRTSLSHLNYHLNAVEGVEDGAFWLPRDVADGVVRPVAFVVAPRLAAPALLAALRTRLEPVFLPRRVVHVAALPREATGKLTDKALHAFAQATLGDAP